MTGSVALSGKAQVSTSRTDQALQAIFSVCASEDVALAIVEAAGKVNGAEFIGQFQEYLSADHRPQFPDVVKRAGGCVALIDCDKDRELAFQTMERLQQTFTHNLKLIAVSTRSDPDFLLRAMRAGCDDVLQRPVDIEHLSATLQRFQRGFIQQAFAPKGSGKVISFFGVKGGVGTTTMVVHLATHLARKHHKKVLVIDHKHELGHIGLHLGLKQSVYHFDELLRNAERLDGELLEGFVTRHPSGLEVIPSPDSCARVHTGTPEAIARVMNYLRTRYDFILVDSSVEYEHSFAALTEASDEVAVISTPDVAALRDLVRRVEHLRAIDGLADKLKVVINRATSEDAVGPKEIEAAVKFPISIAVPNNYAALLRAINEGEPISPQQRSPFTQAIAQWSERIAAEKSAALTAASVKKKAIFGIF
jgi:pilus assembly protein CpaE